MTVKEYLEAIAQADAAMVAARQERAALYKRFEEEHAQHKIGDIVDGKYGGKPVRVRVDRISSRSGYGDVLLMVYSGIALKADGTPGLRGAERVVAHEAQAKVERPNS